MSEGAVGAPLVLVFTGLPGTGKSTLADLIARTLRAPAFSGDWLMGALKPSGALAGLNRESSLDIYYRLLWTLVTRQLMLGQSAVVDCLVNDSMLVQWREQTRTAGARLLLVECVCTDTDLHRSRVEGRVRAIPGWHEIGWDHVERMRQEYPSPSAVDLTVDSVNPLPDNVKAALELIEG